MAQSRDPRAWLIGGLLVAGCSLGSVAISAFIGEALLRYQTTPISVVAVAILLGMLVTYFFPALAGRGAPALAFCTTAVLQTGIVLLGLRLSLGSASGVALQALPIVIACITMAIVTVSVCARYLAVERPLAILLAVGTSICGVTAVVATAPLLQARERDVSYATACIALYGLTAVIVYPTLAQLLFAGSALPVGLFLGTSIHDTAQVVGAAMAYDQLHAGDPAIEIATVTKLVRNLFMVILIPLAAMLAAASRPAGGGGALARPRVPPFVLAFGVMCAARTMLDMTGGSMDPDIASRVDSLVAGAATLSGYCLLAAMAAVGLRTRLVELTQVGWQPLVLALLTALAVGCTSIAAIRFLYL
jgi:uncharacterized integral membrane protein (TIGR00698 family)